MSNYRDNYQQGYRPPGGYRGGAYPANSGNAILPVPGAPSAWHDAANIDGTNNSSLTDGQGIAAWVNLGSLGSGLDLAQATSGARPVYNATGQAGKLNSAPAASGDGARFITNGSAIASQAQPYIVATVFKVTDTAGSYYIWTGFVDGIQHELIANFGGANKLQINNGGGFVDTTKTFVAGQWNMEVAIHNGASSIYRLNGAASAALQTNAVAWTGLTLFGSHSGLFLTKGAIAVRMVWVGSASAPIATDIEAYFVSRFGGFPQ